MYISYINTCVKMDKPISSYSIHIIGIGYIILNYLIIKSNVEQLFSKWVTCILKYLFKY